MLKHIIHIGLTVSDIDRSIDFYQNTLGLSFQGQMLMEGEATDLLFGQKNTKVKVAYLNGSQELFSPPIELLQFVSSQTKLQPSKLNQTSISEICFHVDNIEEVYKTLKEKGVTFISEPLSFDFTSQGYGKSKAVYFKDPDGIILELLEPQAQKF